MYIVVVKNITYDIHSFKWDINSNTFYGDAWNLYEVGSYYKFPFPNGKKQFYIKNFGTHRFRRFRFVKEIKIDYTDQWLFESEDGIKCMVKINKNIMKTIGQQINWDFEIYGFLEIRNKNNNPIYYENPDGDWYKWRYDSNGNEIYFETSNEYWKKREYDSENNLTCSENSVGDWERWEYDSQGKEIYYENSNGFWTKREWDSKGNEIYFESSNGKITDNRPKLCKEKVIEIDGEKYVTKKLMIEFARQCMLKLVTEYPPNSYPEVSAQNMSKISKILNEYIKNS